MEVPFGNGWDFLFENTLLSSKSIFVLDNSYTLITAEDFMAYEFDSVGPKGIIRKMMQYSRIGNTETYNLGFGDKNLEINEINDLIVSNNQDGIKVLTTVTKTVFSFLNRYPQAAVFATGSTRSRTRLYRIGISNYYEFVALDYKILGYKDGEWHTFQKNTDYEGFYIKKKIAKFGL